MLNIKCSESALWHKRYGHINYGDMEKIIKNEIVRGININKNYTKFGNKCLICSKCKITSLYGMTLSVLIPVLIKNSFKINVSVFHWAYKGYGPRATWMREEL